MTKWKNRRRSTKSDHERKSQDREHVISQMTNRVVPNFEKSEAQGKELPQRYESYQTTLCKHLRCPDDDTLCFIGLSFQSIREQVSSRRDNPGPLSSRQCPPTSGLRPHTVALLSRSYTSKAALCPTSSHPPLVSVHTSVWITVLCTQICTCWPSAPQGPSLGPTPVSDGLLSGKEATVSSSSLHPTAVGAVTGTVSSGGVVLEQGEEKGTVEQATGVHKYLSSTLSWSGSASLPRGFRRSEGSSRPSSTVTTKPYGTRPSRVTSLPRMYNVSATEWPPVKSAIFIDKTCDHGCDLHLMLFSVCLTTASAVWVIHVPTPDPELWPFVSWLPGGLQSWCSVELWEGRPSTQIHQIFIN